MARFSTFFKGFSSGICLVLVLVNGTNIGPYRPQGFNVEYAMTMAGIIPDILPNAPKSYVWVEYYGRFPVLLGNELRPSQVKDKPFFHYVAEKDAMYTIAMIDPDAVSRKNPNISQVLHFLVGNIPGNNVHGGDMRAEYIGAEPPENTGPHRYVFFVFKQPGQVEFEEEKIMKDSDLSTRINFKIKDFAEKYNLGDPVAGNFYFARYEYPYPSFYKKSSGFRPNYYQHW